MSDPISGVAFTSYLTLVDITDPRFFLTDPPIVAGDFNISKDGGALANLTNLPAADPSGSALVKIDLTSAEMTGENISIVAIDQSADAWESLSVLIDTQASGNSDSIYDILVGDHTETKNNVVIKKRGTATVLLAKDISGSLLAEGVTINTTDTP